MIMKHTLSVTLDTAQVMRFGQPSNERTSDHSDTLSTSQELSRFPVLRGWGRVNAFTPTVRLVVHLGNLLGDAPALAVRVDWMIPREHFQSLPFYVTVFILLSPSRQSERD